MNATVGPGAGNRRYDHIIVGAGSAGATLAARLSETPTRRVLLVEAGSDYPAAAAPPAMRAPNFWGIFDDPRYRWAGLSARRTATQSPRPFACGRGTGGSSAINAQLAMRGMQDDYDGWSRRGCAGWAAHDVLSDFVRLENDLDFGDAPYHGRTGALPIVRTPVAKWGIVNRALSEAALDLGYDWAPDHNAPASSGVSPYASSQRGGRRISTNDAYLEPARGRTNLDILGGGLVERVLFDGTYATGVRVHASQGTLTIEGGEVLLAAGAIHSPAILLRSGVGSADELRALDLAVVADLSGVGRNLADHPVVAVPLLPHAAEGVSSEVRPFTCCVRYSSEFEGAGDNDMILIGCEAASANSAIRPVGSVMASVFQSFSRGQVRLVDPQPAAVPAIDLALLSDPRDLSRMRDALRRMVELVSRPAMVAATKPLALKHLQVPQDLADESEVDHWLLQQCESIHHPVGTCRMGPVDDPGAVVDSDGRVHGVAGLRVVDASIMPDIPRANPNLTVVMIAEHLSRRLTQ